MKKITFPVLVLVAMTASGCASNRFTSGDNSITTPVACRDGVAVYSTNFDNKNQNKISFNSDGILTGRDINGSNYYMHPDVMLFIEQNKDSSNLYLIDDTSKTKDGMTYKSLYNVNKTNYDAICGQAMIQTLPTQQSRTNLAAARMLAFKLKLANTGKISLERTMEENSDFYRNYPRFPAYQAILKKHIPGYSESKNHIADPVAVLTYFIKNKEKREALDADLESYFTGQYQTDADNGGKR